MLDKNEDDALVLVHQTTMILCEKPENSSVKKMKKRAPIPLGTLPARGAAVMMSRTCRLMRLVLVAERSLTTQTLQV